MAHEPTYGALFVKHLMKVGGRVPYDYKDLQQVKAMSQAELADWIKSECREFSQAVRDNPADVAAEMVHKKRADMAASSPAACAAECAGSFLELLAHLFSTA